MSKDEFFSLEKVYNKRVLRFWKQKLELDLYFSERENKEIKIKEELEKIEKIRIKLEEEDKYWGIEMSDYYIKSSGLENDLKTLINEEHKIRFEANKSEIVRKNLFREFEFSNLIRLGLIKEVKEFYAKKQTLEIPNEMSYERNYFNVDLDIDVDSTTEYILTELGELFYKVCQEKNKPLIKIKNVIESLSEKDLSKSINNMLLL